MTAVDEAEAASEGRGGETGSSAMCTEASNIHVNNTVLALYIVE